MVTLPWSDFWKLQNFKVPGPLTKRKLKPNVDQEEWSTSECVIKFGTCQKITVLGFTHVLSSPFFLPFFLLNRSNVWPKITQLQVHLSTITMEWEFMCVKLDLIRGSSKILPPTRLSSKFIFGIPIHQSLSCLDFVCKYYKGWNFIVGWLKPNMGTSS